MAKIYKTVLILLCCIAAYIATGVVSGGGHGTLAPILIVGSWPFLFLKVGLDYLYRSYSIHGQAIGMAAILSADIVYIWLFLRRLFSTNSLVPFIRLVLFHLLGGAVSVIAIDDAAAIRDVAGSILGYVVGFGLAAMMFTILFLLNRIFAGTASRRGCAACL